MTELQEARAAAQRIRDEYAEFGTLYPDVSVQSIPDDAWEDIRRGIPIAAAYALAERRRAHTAEVADEANKRNANRSSGEVSGEAPSFFTAREVRAMTPAEVRENYRKILLSMPKWAPSV